MTRARRRVTTRVTSAPEVPAPALFCPSCGRPLRYRETVFGGVVPPERWDYYHCGTCGEFSYRQRTRRLTAKRD
ncbi:MAG: hypothetical protein AB7Q29_08325 [Vicinamibacterales bacterium]